MKLAASADDILIIFESYPSPNQPHIGLRWCNVLINMAIPQNDTYPDVFAIPYCILVYSYYIYIIFFIYISIILTVIKSRGIEVIVISD